MIYLGLFLASCAHCGLRSFQSLNVVNSQWLRVPLVSLGIACAEVLLIDHVADEGWGLIVLPLTVGGTLGCWAGMFLNLKLEEMKTRKK